METMSVSRASSYQPPLRGAVLFAVGLGRGAVTIETLAELAQVEIPRARAFATILVARGAIAETPLGFIQGEAWADWSQRPSRSRPHRTTDPLSSDERTSMRQALRFRVRAEMQRRGWSLNELSRRSGVYHQYLYNLDLYASPPPACEVVALARALDCTVEDLVRAVPADHLRRPTPLPA